MATVGVEGSIILRWLVGDFAIDTLHDVVVEVNVVEPLVGSLRRTLAARRAVHWWRGRS